MASDLEAVVWNGILDQILNAGHWFERLTLALMLVSSGCLGAVFLQAQGQSWPSKHQPATRCATANIRRYAALRGNARAWSLLFTFPPPAHKLITGSRQGLAAHWERSANHRSVWLLIVTAQRNSCRFF